MHSLERLDSLERLGLDSLERLGSLDSVGSLERLGKGPSKIGAAGLVGWPTPLGNTAIYVVKVRPPIIGDSGSPPCRQDLMILISNRRRGESGTF